MVDQTASPDRPENCRDCLKHALADKKRSIFCKIRPERIHRLW
jgi:hypothetical protein